MNESKKIEPTEAMVDEAANCLCLDATGTSLRVYDDPVKLAYRNRVTPALRAALNHPDAPGLFTGEDDRPWKPLKKGDPLHAGDEVRQEWYGVTRSGIVGSVDGNGDPWTAEGGYIGPILGGTWYVHRPAPTTPAEEVELPTEPCVLTDVRLREALVAGVALWTGLEVVAAGFNGLAAVHPVSDLTAFTLPDGNRARRGGDHPDGEPRFFKTQEEA